MCLPIACLYKLTLLSEGCPLTLKLMPSARGESLRPLSSAGSARTPRVPLRAPAEPVMVLLLGCACTNLTGNTGSWCTSPSVDALQYFCLHKVWRVAAFARSPYNRTCSADPRAGTDSIVFLRIYGRYEQFLCSSSILLAGAILTYGSASETLQVFV